MTPQELIKACEAKVFDPGKKEWAVPPHIYLTVRTGKPPQGRSIRLAGNRGPHGRICIVRNDGDDFTTVAVFKRAKVIAFAKTLIGEEQADGQTRSE